MKTTKKNDMRNHIQEITPPKNSTFKAECCFCNEVIEFEDESDEKAVEYMEEQGWRIISSEVYQTTGLACSVCVSAETVHRQQKGRWLDEYSDLVTELNELEAALDCGLGCEDEAKALLVKARKTGLDALYAGTHAKVHTIASCVEVGDLLVVDGETRPVKAANPEGITLTFRFFGGMSGLVFKRSEEVTVYRELPLAD